MKVIIAGSRAINDYTSVCHAVQQSGFSVSRVLSGMAAGVDTLAIRYATENGLPLDPFPAQWSQWGRSAGYKRNVQMADNAEALIAVWDGQSRGTQHMIQVAKARGLQVFVALPSTDPQLPAASTASPCTQVHCQSLTLPLKCASIDL